LTGNNAGIHRWGGRILGRGDIILLHYVPGLDKQLQMLEKELTRLNLRPARLMDYVQKMNPQNPKRQINLMMKPSGK
jgi:hypothetical protein